MSEISIGELETEQSMLADSTRHRPHGRHIDVERGVERYSPIQAGLAFLPFHHPWHGIDPDGEPPAQTRIQGLPDPGLSFGRHRQGLDLLPTGTRIACTCCPDS
jgi:hypothetical protein